MFTGLVKDIGRVISVERNLEGKYFKVLSKALANGIGIDDSVAVNGVCQTVTRIEGEVFGFKTVGTSLDKTALGTLISGDYVNLELALKVSDRFGGHFVLGHVNGVGKIKQIIPIGDSKSLSINLSEQLMPYVSSEGSITIDGISLTISKVDRANNSIELSIIPHTWYSTCLQYGKVGNLVNIEVDIIAKYLETLQLYNSNSNSNSRRPAITQSWLQSKGF